MKAIGHHHKGLDAFSNGKYGEEISRFNLAKSMLSTGLESKLAKHAPSQLLQQLKTLQASIDAVLPKLVKDNDVVCRLSVLLISRHGARTKSRFIRSHFRSSDGKISTLS